MTNDILANNLTKSELGKQSNYDDKYNPSRLFAVPRVEKRQELSINADDLPFFGFDCWNHYEVSWLNPKGKPMVATAVLVYACDTPNIIESKSLKLYFNSLNQTIFESVSALQAIIKRDLGACVEGEVFVNINLIESAQKSSLNSFEGILIDTLDVSCSDYSVATHYLAITSDIVAETLCSNLLRSNCPITNQPDWGSVLIQYKGNKIDHEGLLKYLVSFRNHNDFHEQCMERVFMDIMTHCHPESLTVYGRYTRRGGLDINPYRSTEPVVFSEQNYRLIRQ